MKQAPLKAQQPTEEEVEISEAFPASALELPASLPKTASSLPLVALMGFLALGCARLLRYAGANRT
jgi:hypothetical protein